MKVKSQLYDEASGSIGSLTASNGNGGLYLKNKTTPSNPNTAKQVVVRNALASANTSWGSMTNANREKWEKWGATLTNKNSIGNTIKISGWAAFVGAYVLMTQAGMSTTGILTSAPATEGYASATNITAVNSSNKVAVSTTNIHSRNVAVYTSAGVKKTINNYAGGYNFNKKGALINGTNLVTTQPTKSGFRYYVAVQAIGTDGRYSRKNIITLDT